VKNIGRIPRKISVRIRNKLTLKCVSGMSGTYTPSGI
jgi:hypothetical protein